MESFHISALLNILSLLLGLAAWVLAVLAIRASKAPTAHRNTTLSFSFCAFALLVQLAEIFHRARAGDYAGIDDTIGAVLLASLVLTLITAALNTAALVKTAASG